MPVSVPAAQEVHVVAPAADIFPEEQDTQDACPIEPVNLPATQLVQTDSPVDAAIVPAEQEVHTVRPLLALILPVAQLAQTDNPVDGA